jgi:outer membrane biosynthesis protein TonB
VARLGGSRRKRGGEGIAPQVEKGSAAAIFAEVEQSIMDGISERKRPPAVLEWRVHPRMHQSRTVSTKFIQPGAPMTVLSLAPAGVTGRPKLVISAIIIHGLIVAGLSGRVHSPVNRPVSATIEMVTAPAVSPVVPDQGPSPASPVTEAADTKPSDPGSSTDKSEPTTEPPPPMPAPNTQATEPPRTAERSPIPDASAQPVIAGEDVTSAAKLTTAPPPGMTAAGHSGSPHRPVVSWPPSSRGKTRLVTASSRLTAAAPAMPESRMMGQSGKAGIAFDYRDGAIVGRAQLTRSSGMPVLDAAALTAVGTAHYPQAQPGDAHQLFHLLIWVEEACGG